MNALIAALALAIDRGWARLDQRRGRGWFRVYMSMMDEQFGELPDWGDVLPVALWVGVPTLAAVLALWFLAELHPALATLGGLGLVVAVLGPQHAGRAGEAYARDLDADGDGLVAAAGLLRAAAPVAPVERSAAVVEALSRLILERQLGPATWVALAGPPGAVLWRVMVELEVWLEERARPGDVSRRTALEALRGVLAWLPVRALGLSLAFAGRSEETFAAWRGWRAPAGATRQAADLDLLMTLARAALSEPADAEDRGAHQVWAALALLDRALLLWVMTLSLLWLAWMLT